MSERSGWPRDLRQNSERSEREQRRERSDSERSLLLASSEHQQPPGRRCASLAG